MKPRENFGPLPSEEAVRAYFAQLDSVSNQLDSVSKIRHVIDKIYAESQQTLLELKFPKTLLAEIKLHAQQYQFDDCRGPSSPVDKLEQELEAHHIIFYDLHDEINKFVEQREKINHQVVEQLKKINHQALLTRMIPFLQKELNSLKEQINASVLHKLEGMIQQEEMSPLNERVKILEEDKLSVQKKLNQLQEIITSQSTSLSRVFHRNTTLNPPPDRLAQYREQFGKVEDMDPTLKSLWDSSENFLEELGGAEESDQNRLFVVLTEDLRPRLHERQFSYEVLIKLFYQKFPEFVPLEAVRAEVIQPEPQVTLPSVIQEKTAIQPSMTVLNPEELEPWPDLEPEGPQDVQPTQLSSPIHEEEAIEEVEIDDESPFSYESKVDSVLSKKNWTVMSSEPPEQIKEVKVKDRSTINKVASESSIVYFFQKFHEFLTRILHFIFCENIPIVAYHWKITPHKVVRQISG